MENNLPLEKEIGGIFEKFPPLPDNAKEILVQIAPWCMAILAIVGGLATLSLIGLGSIVSAASIGVGSYGSVWQMWVGIIALAIMAILAILAFNPLRSRQRKGWSNLYYIQLISTASSILSFSFVSAILGFLIGFWILFQTKEKYS